MGQHVLDGKSKRQTLLNFFLVFGILIQGALLIGRALPDILQVWELKGQHGVWRSAWFSQGGRFARYIGFLNENIPQDARVVLPPTDAGLRALGRTPYMQFFLAPRTLINCTASNCLQGLSRVNTYILVVGDFPGADQAGESGVQLMFDKQWGLMLPEDHLTVGKTGLPPFNNAFEILWAILWPALWLALLAISGVFLTDCLAPGYALPTRIALGYGLGLIVFSISVAALSLVGVSIQSRSILGVSVLLLLCSLVGAALCRRRLKASYPAGLRASVDIWQAAYLAMGIFALALSVGQGYHATDEVLLWGAKGYGISASGFLKDVTQWGTNTVPYPLHIPVLIASFRTLFGEVLPAGKMIFPGYYLGLLIIVDNFLRSAGVKRETAGLATIFIATTPVVFRHAILAYTNLVLSFYLVSAALFLIETLQTNESAGMDGVTILSGLLFAAAAWTRPEGLIASWVAVAVILGFSVLMGSNALTQRRLALLFTPLIAYALFWRVLKTAIYSGQIGRIALTDSAISQIWAGKLHLGEALYVIRSILLTPIEVRSWGLFGVGITLVVIIAIFTKPRDITGWQSMITGLFLVIMIAGIYYITSYGAIHDVSWWVKSGMDRMLLPGFLLLWLGGVVASMKVER